MNRSTARDNALLLDALIAARHAMHFAAAHDFDGFAQDALVQSAVMHQVQIIGEAARGISADCRLEHAHIPWNEIVGMRNRLVHDYSHIAS